MFSLRISVCFLKRYHVWLSIVKMGVWNGSQTMWDSFQTSVFNAENLSFIVSETLHVCASLCLRVHASWPHTQVDSCVHKLRVSLALPFQK